LFLPKKGLKLKKIIFLSILLILIGCGNKDNTTDIENNKSNIDRWYSKSLNYTTNFANMTKEETKKYAIKLRELANENIKKIPLDTIASKIAVAGIPAVVIIGIASTSGLVGGAAIVSAISTASGGAGLIPGIVALGFIAVASQAIIEYGSENVMKEVVNQLKEQGHTDEEIIETIENYPISDSLRNDVLKLLKR